MLEYLASTTFFVQGCFFLICLTSEDKTIEDVNKMWCSEKNVLGNYFIKHISLELQFLVQQAVTM